MRNKPELLSPAGDLERLKVALIYGADAVYIGGPAFGLRANAVNFTLEEIKEGVEFAHNLKKKVYVTVNIILHNDDTKELVKYLIDLDEIGVDAIIISDPTVITLAKKHTNLEIHLSTQQSTLNYEAVEFYKNLGVTRIVMGRELSKEELKEIKSKVDLDIEIFIHGAMCASYSGRCVLSNYLTNRDANRGGCSQICRWDFNLLDENKNKLKGLRNFTFCTKDLILCEYLNDIIDLGITSLKIEGRMRSLYYVATVVLSYRKLIDNIYKNNSYNSQYENALRRVANRDSIAQFFNGINNEACNYYNNRDERSNQDFLGIVLDYEKNGKIAVIEQRNLFKIGDEVEFFGPNLSSISYKIKAIFDEENMLLEVVNHPKQIVRIPIDIELEKYDLMRIK